MTYEMARKAAAKYLRSIWNRTDDNFVIADEETLHKDFGWVFFWQSERYLKTEEISDMLVNNVPLIVSKSNGKIYPTGSSRPIEYWIELFRRGELNPVES